MIKRLLVVVWLFTCTFISYAANYQSHQLNGNQLIIKTDEGSVSLKALTDSAIEAFYQPTGVKQLPGFAIDEALGEHVASVQEREQVLVFNAGKITAHINKKPLRIDYFRGNERIVGEEVGLFVQDTVRGFRFNLSKQEKLMGGGQRVLGMDRRGQRLPLYNRAHYGYSTESHQMYYSLPAVMSDKKYALVFDNTANGFMDIGHTESDILQFEAVGGRTAYIVIAGENYPSLIENFTQVTGHQPLPPRWAMGNFASRFGYRNEQETRDVVSLFVEQDFPLDAVVLDLYWFGPDIQGHMGNLDWDRQAFPNPEKMIEDFAQSGVNTVVITEPFILTTSKNWESAKQAEALAKNHAGDPRRFDFYFGNTGLVDVFSEQGYDWFADFYKRLYKQGITGWWGDLGEPEVHPADSLHSVNGITATGDEIHNAYGHKWAELVYNTQREIDPSSRPMVMMRSGFVGSQRFGMIPWTGDVSRSWGGLKPQVELSLQMSVLGLAYTHSDLGGFAGGESFDKEMYIRWLQYGVFQPVYRPHAQEAIAPEPVFHDQQTQDITRQYIKLRYRMLPYNYSLAFENSMKGAPLMRPMVFEDEANAAYFDMADQYFWGNEFLVKPVTDPGVESVDVTLPDGVWFDFWRGNQYQGGKSVAFPVDLNTIPVLVRAGALLPMAQDMTSTQFYNPSELTLHYYADESVEHSSAKMYEDDGKTANTIENGQYQTLTFDARRKGQSLALNIDVAGHYPNAPEQRQLKVIVHNWKSQPESISVDGKSTDFVWRRGDGRLSFDVNLSQKLKVSIQ